MTYLSHRRVVVPALVGLLAFGLMAPAAWSAQAKKKTAAPTAAPASRLAPARMAIFRGSQLRIRILSASVIVFQNTRRLAGMSSSRASNSAPYRARHGAG